MNPDLFDFFRTHYCWGRVALVGASDWIGEAIRAGQRGLTRDGHPSRWSHTFILGELRPDRRGPQGTKGCGLELIHELAALLGEHLPKGRFRSGPVPLTFACSQAGDAPNMITDPPVQLRRLACCWPASYRGRSPETYGTDRPK